jgi:chondroitin 4-sulfotransferase 11
MERTGLQEHFKSMGDRPGIIVCPKHKFIYMKPPRTAGSSILRNFLEGRFDELLNNKDHAEQFGEWLASTNDEALSEYFVFSVTRNPWDRFLSASKYLGIPMSKLIDNWNTFQEVDQVRVHTRPINFYTHYQSRQFVDRICRFETLQADMNLVSDSLGIARSRLPFVNATKHDHYSKYYKEDAIEFVRGVYELDIKYFGYEFEAPVNKQYTKDRSLLGKFVKRLKKPKAT